MKPFYEILEMIKAHYENNDSNFNKYAGMVVDYYRKDGNLQGVEEILQIMRTGHLEPRTSMPKLIPVHKEADADVNRINTNGTDVSKTDINQMDMNETDINTKTAKSFKNRQSEETNGNIDIPDMMPEKASANNTDLHDDIEPSIETAESDTKLKPAVDKQQISKPKRHRRTKAEMEACRRSLQNGENNTVESRKAKNEASDAYKIPIEQMIEAYEHGNVTNVDALNINVTPESNKNVKVTTSTLEMNKENMEQCKPKRHRRTKAEMEAARVTQMTEEINAADNENKPKRHRRTKAEMQAARLAESNKG